MGTWIPSGKFAIFKEYITFDKKHYEKNCNS